MDFCDDIVSNKIAIIKRCLQRVYEEYDAHETALETDFARQDAIVLNLQRAIKACIDLGMRIVKQKRLGVPQRSHDVFVLLEQAKVISYELSKHFQLLLAFIYVAVRDYTNFQPDCLRAIIANHLHDFEEFTRCATFCCCCPSGNMWVVIV